MKNKSSAVITAIIIIVVLAVVGGVSWYVISQKQPSPSLSPSAGEEDQFKDWKTYRNEEYGFEVKYPEDWTSTENSEEQVVFFEPGSGPIKEHLGDIFINIISNPNKLTIDKYIQTKPPIIEEIKTINMAGKIARQIGESGMLAFKTTIIPMENYFIEITKDENYQKERDEIYNQILSTFKFTK